MSQESIYPAGESPPEHLRTGGWSGPGQSQAGYMERAEAVAPETGSHAAGRPNSVLLHLLPGFPGLLQLQTDKSSLRLGAEPQLHVLPLPQDHADSVPLRQGLVPRVRRTLAL